MSVQPVFSKARLSDHLAQIMKRAVDAVAARPSSEIINDPEDVIQSTVAKFRVEPLVFDFERMTRSDPLETTLKVQGRDSDRIIDVPATGFEYSVPFTGDPDLLWLQASTFTYAPQPRVEKRDNTILMKFSSQDITADWVKSEVSSARSQLVQGADWSSSEVSQWNASLEGAVASSVRQREALLQKGRAIADELDS
ncbi:hypothetical protein [Arthrobacter sp. SDTb3-6]|uniref:hypothetical protein n=1 Tax=Arthrobacter sp. SDTb3-6 TaxID=2713571 RepID=UPI00159D8CF1|nr:hypothetical protein [Arthrobacter sp. SDTb3-6]NVN00776.1 hypothetical protein [Arthrobacter sp. SDTb3-6]